MSLGPGIRRKRPSSILTQTGGFLKGYTHTLNPYTGCAFACSYCYVRQMPVSLFRGQEWGTWVDIKDDAPDLLRKELAKAHSKGPVTIFMSSATDPYQPEEAKEQMTRKLVEAMLEQPPDFLFVQTRSPLVTRDLDLYTRFGDRVRISMTVETDLEDVRRAFAPSSPPLAGRLRALRAIREAGIPNQAAVAPLLPHSDGFAAILARVADRVTVDTYFLGDGSHGKRTERIGVKRIYEERGWMEWYRPEILDRFVDLLRTELPETSIRISEQGFMPN